MNPRHPIPLACLVSYVSYVSSPEAASNSYPFQDEMVGNHRFGHWLSFAICTTSHPVDGVKCANHSNHP
jgi:hypothetical protein